MLLSIAECKRVRQYVSKTKAGVLDKFGRRWPLDTRLCMLRFLNEVETVRLLSVNSSWHSLWQNERACRVLYAIWFGECRPIVMEIFGFTTATSWMDRFHVRRTTLANKCTWRTTKICTTLTSHTVCLRMNKLFPCVDIVDWMSGHSAFVNLVDGQYGHERFDENKGIFFDRPVHCEWPKALVQFLKETASGPWAIRRQVCDVKRGCYLVQRYHPHEPSVSELHIVYLDGRLIGYPWPIGTCFHLQAADDGTAFATDSDLIGNLGKVGSIERARIVTFDYEKCPAKDTSVYSPPYEFNAMYPLEKPRVTVLRKYIIIARSSAYLLCRKTLTELDEIERPRRVHVDELGDDIILRAGTPKKIYHVWNGKFRRLPLTAALVSLSSTFAACKRTYGFDTNWVLHDLRPLQPTTESRPKKKVRRVAHVNTERLDES